MRAAVMTVSDRSYRGERPDLSGPTLCQLFKGVEAEIVETVVVPDESHDIVEHLVRLSDDLQCDVIITTGGTGLSPRDMTPDATSQVIDRTLPAMAYALWHESVKQTPYAMLSRAIVGVRGHTLIINMPGNPKAVKECFAVVAPVLQHAVQLLRDADPYTEETQLCHTLPTSHPSS